MTSPILRRKHSGWMAGGLAVASAVALTGADTRPAHACGCFTPPDPSVPILQAGERILFAMEDGIVTANIQIQYAGDAKEFGWLLPLPSVPTLELGTDELFTRLIGNTQPKYRLDTKYDGNCGFAPRGGKAGLNTFGPTAAPSGAAEDAGHSPLVIQDSIGPYDYAVLKADSKDDMLKWLSDNHYFVPAGTDETVGAYIRPGAFFLALKLRSGQSTGDLQPVVVRYPSDLPMIPIVLTSVAAQPNMGVQVWMLGAGRAIPRNYYHTVINDVALDWLNAGQNYNDVVIKAVSEAPAKHSFVTEYAGTSAIMQNTLNYPGRFGTTAELAASPDAAAFGNYLTTHGYPFTSQLTAILGRYIPFPPNLAAQGITPANFYSNLSYYLDQYQQQNPAAFDGWAGVNYQPAMMAQEIEDRVVKPTVEAAALFDKFPKLTRLYTTLSPDDMTLDPVFSFNASLPDVAKEHVGTLTYYCGLGSNDRPTTPARLVTEQGWSVDYAKGLGTAAPPPPQPEQYTRRLEILREEGAPQVVTDNAPTSGCGCAIPADAGRPTGGLLLVVAAAAMGLRRRRGRRG